MANTQGNGQPDSGSLDFNSFIQSLLNHGGSNSNYEAQIAQYLRVIATQMTRNPNAFNGNNKPTQQSQSNYAESKWTIGRNQSNADSSSQYRGSGDVLKDFVGSFKDSLLDAAFGGDFKQGIRNAMNTFTKEFGMDIRKIPQEAGKQLGKKVFDTFSNSKFGQSLKSKASQLGNGLLNRVFDRYGADGQAAKQGLKNVFSSLLNRGAGSSSGAANFAGQFLQNGGGQIGSKVVSSGAGKLVSTVGAKGVGTAIGGNAMAGLMKGASSLGPWGLLIAGVIYTITKVLGPALKGLADMAKALAKSWNREENQRKVMLENAKERLKADVRALAEEPFKILKEAAQKWAQTWDTNLRTIGQTQGYDKESVYALFEGYAQRLREEGLGSVINATDITDKLSSVLNTGLSGAAAEEFAYIATKLGAAIPTQDFFQYADTYASIAANAVAQGKSQEQALDMANAELEQFASNLLYASRELAGGFSTGLQNSSDLFKSATQIAQAAKTYNASDISGTLTSVSGIIGAVAPDLASSLVNNVVEAALGGNSNTIVALRSLAGINAGNTEFLQALANNPKEVFSSLFTQLGNLQTMSPDNYMEVAEGLASVFGIDKAAFARVDFNYLARAINAMQVNYDSLTNNLALLASGQTTTSAEQLKAEEINRVILEEGLAYVIDSEAGRMIQEHMWDEQMKNELENTTYSVEIQGAALSFLEGIRKTVTTLLNFLNPLGWAMKGIANMAQSISESVGNDQDIKEILALTAVGANTKSFANLTTRGKNLGLTTSLVEMLGGTKGVKELNDMASFTRNFGNSISNFTSIMTTGIPTPTADQINQTYDFVTGTAIASALNKSKGVKKSSRYAWGVVGKSLADAVQSTSMNTNVLGSVAKSTDTSTKFAQEQSNKRFQEFLDSAKEASKEMSYEQWIGTAKNFGISNYSDALDYYGKSEDEVKNYFEQHEAAQGSAIEENRKKDEELLRQQTREFWGFEAGGVGTFNTTMWTPFYGAGQKYDTTMNAVRASLTEISTRIGFAKEYAVTDWLAIIRNRIGETSTENTVLGLLSLIQRDIQSTFMGGSVFQTCLADWTRYITETEDYTKALGGTRNKAWSDFSSATKDQQTQATLALANALGVFSAEQLKSMDPQLQANVLLGQILVVLQAIMQQNNSVAGGLSLIDTVSALGMGMTNKK